MRQRRGIVRTSGLVFGFLLLVTILASTISIVPVAYAATPLLDCGSTPHCIATSGRASGSGHPITMTGSLSTSSSPDLIVVIETGDATGENFTTPTLTGVAFTSVCTSTSSAPIMGIYAGEASSLLSGATVTATVDGNTGASVGGMVAFGISGYDSSATSAFDGTCGTTSASSGSALSLSTGSLAYGNDFIFGVAASSKGTISSTGSTTSIAANTAAVYTGAGYQLGSGASSYTLTFSSSSSGAWTEAVAAVKAATPSAVPLFPAGMLPLLTALPLIYYYMARRGVANSEEDDSQ